MNTQDFVKFGLSEREAKMYKTVLLYGEANLGFLSKMSNIKRTTAYDVIRALTDKGLISRVRANKRYNYFANDPREYQKILEDKKSKLSAIIPQLLDLMPKKNQVINLKYFEGEAGIKEIFRDAVARADTEIMVWLPAETVIDKVFYEKYNLERMEKCIFERIITNQTPGMEKLQNRDSLRNRQTRLAPTTAPIEAEIIVYGQNLAAVISFQSNMGLIIESEYIHTTLKNIFELNWHALK